MAAAGITIVKSFLYRGVYEEWSNTYHLSAAPSSRANWIALANALGAAESPCMSSSVTYQRALCYADTDNASTYTLYNGSDLTANSGGCSAGSDVHASGDQAAVLSWNTGLSGSTGKAVWLRKYFHGSFVKVYSNQDSISTTLAANLATFGAALLTTAINGSIYFADKTGRRPDGPVRVDSVITTRTLKRRGKRPS